MLGIFVSAMDSSPPTEWLWGSSVEHAILGRCAKDHFSVYLKTCFPQVAFRSTAKPKQMSIQTVSLGGSILFQFAISQYLCSASATRESRICAMIQMFRSRRLAPACYRIENGSHCDGARIHPDGAGGCGRMKQNR
jgi:hypothetical protein